MRFFQKKNAVPTFEAPKPAPAQKAGRDLDWRALAGTAADRLDEANAAVGLAREKLTRLRSEAAAARSVLEALAAERDAAVEATGRAALARVRGEMAPAPEGRPLAVIAAEITETEAVLAALEDSPLRREILAEASWAEVEAEAALDAVLRRASDALTAKLVSDMGPRLAEAYALANRAGGWGGVDFTRWCGAVFGELVARTGACPDDLPRAAERAGVTGDERRELERHGVHAGVRGF
jgi:hypothetical protein